MKRALFPLALSLLVGCETVESGDVLTSGMYADFQAVAHGDGKTEVVAVLKVGGATSNTYVDLGGDDVLTATSDGVSQVLEKHETGNLRNYSTTYSTDAADTAFDVAFTRTVDAGAPSSTMSLPAPFAISAPTAGAEFSRDNDDLTVTWDGGSADAMEVSYYGGCVVPSGATLDSDSGSYTFAAGSIEPSDAQNPQNGCDITVEVRRVRPGTVDPAFEEGGAASGRVVRSVTVSSVQ